MWQGEIRQRLDLETPTPQYVLVLSGNSYLSGPTSRVIVCRVLPGASEDFPGVQRVNYIVSGVTTIGVAVPELMTWLPRSGLAEPVGLVTEMRPILGLVHALFE